MKITFPTTFASFGLVACDADSNITSVDFGGKEFRVNCLDRTIEDNTYTFVAKEQFLADAEDAVDRMLSEALYDWVLEEGCQITIDLNYLAFSSFTKTL